MTVLHTGFDNLDLAIKAFTPLEFVNFLEDGKATAQDMMKEVWGEYAGLMIQSGQNGKRGGYAYTFKVDGFGAVWFAKKPRAKDPWGLFISVGSRELALHGLEKTRARMDELCGLLGFRVQPNGVSINRIDFAVDILAPGFVIDPDAFVFHSRSNRKTIAEFEEIETNGSSGRYTSVTIGKMPGRQVIVYDKRLEVMARRKHEWPLIWNANLRAMGLPELRLPDRSTSQVWRIELRLGKAGLRQRKEIRGWGAFYEHLQTEMVRLSKDVQLCIKGDDSNRSRWHLHPMWGTAQENVLTRLFDHDARVPPEEVRNIDLQEKQHEMLKLIAAMSVPLGYLEGAKPESYETFLLSLPRRLLRFLEAHPRGVEERFAETALKYGHLRNG